MSSESPQPTQGAAALLLWTWTHCHLLSLLREQQHSLYGPGPTVIFSAYSTQGAGVLPLWMTWTHCHLLSPLTEQHDCLYIWILIHGRFASPQPTQGAAAYPSMSTSSETANRHTWHRGILAAITHHPIYYSRSSTTASVFFEPAIWNMAPWPPCSVTSATY